ncbi:MAG TPA: RNA polymerase sigma factor RpoD/SigA [Candidatus Cryosericum sp.]|nr:RNA polymerase sigma factor RpoD/SigA [Candidatus Cryosericum sp.]
MSDGAGRTALGAYLRDIGPYAVLSREEERDVALRLQGATAEEATRDLVQSNLGFVVRVALQFRGRGLPLEDLLNEGNIGLIEAARRFDPARGVRFITFAVHWIKKSMLRALARQTSIVHMPGHKRRQIRRLQGAERSLRDRLGRPPEPEEVSRLAGLTLKEMHGLQGAWPKEVSLDEPIGEHEDQARRDLLTDTRFADPEAGLREREAKRMVERLLATLEQRERDVLVRRYGLEDGERRTLREVAQEFGVSREAVRLIEEKALRLLGRRIMRCQGVAGRTPSTQATACQRAASGNPAQARSERIAAACSARPTRPVPTIASSAPSRMRAMFSASAQKRESPAQPPKSIQVERTG